MKRSLGTSCKTDTQGIHKVVCIPQSTRVENPLSTKYSCAGEWVVMLGEAGTKKISIRNVNVKLKAKGELISLQIAGNSRDTKEEGKSRAGRLKEQRGRQTREVLII